MSLFSDLYQSVFMPALVAWHGDPILYWPTDTDPEIDEPIKLCNALVSDEMRERRRSGDYGVEMVTTRAVQLVTNNEHCEFSGVTHPQQNATIGIAKQCETLRYTVESVIDGDNGMAALSLKRTGRIIVGDREIVGE